MTFRVMLAHASIHDFAAAGKPWMLACVSMTREKLAKPGHASTGQQWPKTGHDGCKRPDNPQCGFDLRGAPRQHVSGRGQHGVQVARRTAADDRQADIFGAILPERPASEPKPSSPRQPKAQRRGGPASHPPQPNAPPEPSIDTLAARLSPADLESLTVTVSDEALARLALAAVRQLRRRLARGGGGRSPGRSKRQVSALDRAARQIAIELGGMAGGDEA